MIRGGRIRIIGAVIGLIALGALFVGAQSTPSSSAAYIARVTNSTNTAASAAYFTCAAAYAADKANATFSYPFAETSGTVASDTSGKAANGTYRGTFTWSTASPYGCARDAAGAAVFNGTNAYVTAPTQVANPQTFSLELWFKTSAPSGKLIGFGNTASGSSGQYDRHVYLTSTGQLSFGVYNSGYNVITSTASYNDNTWHHLVATKSATAGMVLYVDGAVVASNAAYTVGESTTGYWRIGWDNQSGWPGIGTNAYFTGQMRFAAVYSVALSATQVTNHYNAGR